MRDPSASTEVGGCREGSASEILGFFFTVDVAVAVGVPLFEL